MTDVSCDGDRGDEMFKNANILLLKIGFALPALAATVLLLSMAPAFGANTKPLVVFLVRHAEKVVEEGNDPPLTSAGQERAELLAGLLRDSSIDHVHSSNYVRARETAKPAASRLGLELQLYDAGDLEGLVAQLREAGGRHLVVGHSNTTPDAVKLLGGEPGSPIEEGDEYDRLYVVTIGADGGVNTLVLRYGRPPGGG